MRPDLAKYDRWAKTLDTKYRVLGVPVGWDSILGLIPGVGDAITVVPAAVMMNAGYRAGIRKRALGQMAVNTGLDLMVGSIPLVGDLFDFAFKSHTKNVAVLRKEMGRLDMPAAAQTAA